MNALALFLLAVKQRATQSQRAKAKEASRRITDVEK